MPAREKTAIVSRTDADQAVRVRRDHAAIGRLADEVLPALIAKLAGGGLGEIEVRQSGWKARLRKPAGTEEARRSAARGPVEIHAGHGVPSGRPVASHVRGTEDRDRRHDGDEAAAGAKPGRVAATSPAVGIYHPGRDLAIGTPVRAGDRLGWVDVLGVQQDVVAPLDGLIGASLAEAGDAVEYGQDLVLIEPPERAEKLDGPRAERQPAAVGKA
jgi:biotin carboxyl carrier protein